MKTTILLSFTMIALTACASSAPPGPLATVNSEPVTPGDLRQQFVKRHGGHEKFLGGMTEAKRFLDVVIDQRLLVQEAYELGLQNAPEVKEPTDAYREQKAADYLMKTELQDKSVPAKEEICRSWENDTTTTVHARQIVVDSEEEARSLYQALLHGAEFDVLARECSFAQSRMHGGLLPPVTWGSMPPDFEAAVFPLQPGEIAAPFETPDGWQVVQLIDKAEVRRPELEKSSARISAILQKRKLEERKRAFSNALFDKYRVAYMQTDRSAPALLQLAPDTVIARWDGDGSAKVTVKDAFSEGELRMYAAFPRGRADRLVEQRIRVTVNERLVLAEAKARDLGNVPQIAEDVRRFQEERMEGLLYDRHILKDVSITEDDVKQYFEEHTAELVKPERRRIAHIVAPTQQDAEALRKRIANGEEFAGIAKTASLDTQSAKGGGDLGWITMSDVPTEFASVVKIGEGDVSDPIQSKFGWHVVKVSKIEPQRALTFDEANDDIRRLLLQKKQREKRAYWVKKLREVAVIRIDERAVRAFVESSFLK